MCSLRTPGDCMLTIPTLLFQTTSPSWSGWLRANHCCPNDACCCSLRYNVSLPYAGADIQLAIVGDRLISVDVRRIVLDSAQALSDCGRPRSRPGPHPWPAPPAQRAARLAAAVAPDKLISRDAGGGEVLGQWGEAIRANGCRIQPPPHQQQPASATASHLRQGSRHTHTVTDRKYWLQMKMI